MRGPLLAAHENQATTFGTLVRRLAPRRAIRAGLRSWRSCSTWTSSEPLPTFAGLGVEVGYPDKSFVNFDINLNLVETSAGLTLECSYNADLFDRSTVRRWLGHYRVLLESRRWPTCEQRGGPACPCSRTRSAVSSSSIGTRPTAPLSGAMQLHRIFEAQVARTPDAMAVVRGARASPTPS